MKKIYSLFITLSLFSVVTFAQNNLSEEDKRQLQDRVKTHVESFQRYLGDIVNTQLSPMRRQSSIKSALALFIGKGEPYQIVNEYGKSENRNAVKMQISSVNGYSKQSKAIKSYLNNQYKNVHKYSKVVITDADVVRVDNIYKVGEGKYQAAAYFCQKYVAYRDGRIVYGDITTKKVIVNISAFETPVGITWDAKLGDVYVTSTKKL